MARGVRLEVVRCGGERRQGFLGLGTGVGEGGGVIAGSGREEEYVFFCFFVFCFLRRRFKAQKVETAGPNLMVPNSRSVVLEFLPNFNFVTDFCYFFEGHYSVAQLNLDTGGTPARAKIAYV